MRLSRKWADKVVRLPGAGLLYQAVEVILKNDQTVPGLLVLNGQDIIGTVNFSEDDIVDIVASDPEVP